MKKSKENQLFPLNLEEFKLYLCYWLTKPAYDSVFSLEKNSLEYYGYRNSLSSKEKSFFLEKIDLKISSLKEMFKNLNK